MRPLLVVALLAVLSACDRGPVAEARPQAKAPAASRQPFVGKVFEAAYASDLCHMTSADWDARSSGGTAKPQATPRSLEPPLLASTQGRARRQGDALIISGARFADSGEEGDTAVAFSYAGRLPNAPFDVVHGAHWEWTTWYLVDAKGKQGGFGGPPVASPDGRAFAATGDDVEGESMNGVQIATYANGVFASVDLDAFAACDPRWIDNDTLEVKVLREAVRDLAATPAVKPSDWRAVRIVRDGKGWKFASPAA